MSHGKKITYRKRQTKEDIERQITETEQILQPLIIAANPEPELRTEETKAAATPPAQKSERKHLLKWVKF